MITTFTNGGLVVPDIDGYGILWILDEVLQVVDFLPRPLIPKDSTGVQRSKSVPLRYWKSGTSVVETSGQLRYVDASDQHTFVVSVLRLHVHAGRTVHAF